MFIEDLINRLNSDGNFMFADLINLYQFDRGVVASLSNQIIMGLGFTEKQSTLAIRLVKKYSKQLSRALNVDVSPFIDEPQFKLPIRVLSNNKSIQIRKIEGTNKKVISVIFPFDESIISGIKTYKRELGVLGRNINWNTENKGWEFSLREEHIDWISTNIQNSSFSTDEEFNLLVEQIERVKNNLENYVPMVVFDKDRFIFKNVPSSVPQPKNFDLVNILVEAKKYGINTWSEDIDIALDQLEINDALKSFLMSSGAEPFQLNREKTKFSDIVSILRHSLPCLIVIPGGTELRHLELCTKMIQNCGISTQETAVLFRLDGENGKNFNNFVKDQKLNNPINENIKVAFISGKIPKPMIESKLNFSCILNLGISGVHHTLINYLKNHNFVINYTLKESDFAEL